ncbi:MAG: 4-hydroxythreonine-4-phosphate dehydrogenase PdxA, partial [Anaerolineae bacterium]|nr:4-hydroxythreonine-4-phosphate dehydrogenase PdxA [Anaerolineae bacterium]
MTSLPIVGITLGDAAGIGPEVIAKALRRPEVYQVCRPLVIGDARIFAEPKFAAPAPRLLIINTISQAVFASGMVTVLDLHNLHPNAVAMGAVCPASGRAAVAYVVEAAKLALAGKIDALATAPLNKEAMRQAGFDYIGHTEILADVTQTSKCTTMLATTGLRVTHVTRHIPFREIAGYITRDNVLDAIRLTHDGMQRLGFAQPRLAVAALNPHNGEGGLLGREELDEIGPAVT